MAILPVKYPWAIAIIKRGEPRILLVVLVHFGCCKIFGIWNNRLIVDPLWALVCVLLAISLWPADFLYMNLLATLVTSNIWLDRKPSAIATTISTATALEVNWIQSLFYQLLNGHSICLWNWRLFSRLLFAGSRFPLLWIDKIMVFTHILLYKVLIGDELLWSYEIHVTHTKFLDKLHNLLVLMNLPKT